MMKNYEIGGVCVEMTEAQAAAWNAGDVNAEALRGAVAHLTGRSGARSWVDHGMVVVDDGMPTSEAVDLWRLIDSGGEPTVFYAQHMDGMPANLVP